MRGYTGVDDKTTFEKKPVISKVIEPFASYPFSFSWFRSVFVNEDLFGSLLKSIIASTVGFLIAISLRRRVGYLQNNLARAVKSIIEMG